MKKEVRVLFRMARGVVKKDTLKKLKGILDGAEQEAAVKYALITALERKIKKVSMELNEIGTTKDNFIAENKALLIPSKIKHFEVNYSKEEFYKIVSLFKEVRREMANV